MHFKNVKLLRRPLKENFDVLAWIARFRITSPRPLGSGSNFMNPFRPIFMDKTLFGQISFIIMSLNDFKQPLNPKLLSLM
jgi:hypothetical protein